MDAQCLARLPGSRFGRAARRRGSLQALALALVCVGSLAATPDPQASSGEVRELRSELSALRRLVEQLQRQVASQDQRLATLRPPGSSAERTAQATSPTAQATSPVGAGPAPAAAPGQTPEQIELEKQLERELSGAAPPAGRAPAGGAPAAAPGGITLVRGDRNYLNLSFDALVAGGSSTTPDIARLETGGHDPAQRGFTVQNVEMVLDGAVDPYLRGQGNIVFQIDADGGTVVELEEAYLTSTSLPNNLQVKAGQFFSEFGRLNAQHPHTWDFVDQPLVNGRFLGPDGLRGAGARVSWLAPTPFYSELYLGLQNSNGETAFSFRNAPGEEQFGRPVTGRPVRSLDDMVWVPRYSASFDLSETQTLLMGVSGAFGSNATGSNTSTRIWGADLFWKWKPANSEGGFPFLKWQTEVMSRRFEAGATTVAAGAPADLPAETLRDWGGYSQLVWGFQRNWALGLRGDYVRGNQSRFDPDPTRGTHWRVSPALTWYPTEFSKFRLQFNQDRIQGMGSDASLWVQMEFILGAHAAHKF